MKKDELMKLGLDEETAKKVEAASAEELKGFIPKARFDEVDTEKNALQVSLKERDIQLDDLKTSVNDIEGLKKQINDLQTANGKKEKAHAAELKRLKRESLDDRFLAESKAINLLAVKPFLKSIEDSVDDDSYAQLRKQQIEALVKAADTSFLFQAAESAGNADGASKLSGFRSGESSTSSGNQAYTLNDIKKMTPAEINTNWDKIKPILQKG